MKVSVVIPCYYSEKMIGKVVRLTAYELVKAGYEYEFILVNDGSEDGTFAQIKALSDEDGCVVGVDCMKNLGQHAAIMAGLQYTTGEVVMLMDDDMQTHPSQCVKLLKAVEEHPEVDVVFARWQEHKEAWWRRLGSDFTLWSIRVMTKRPKDIYPSNFFVMRSYVRDELVRYKGPYPYLQGLLFRATNRMMNVDVEHFEREMGSSGYTLKSLMRLWATVFGFSMLPLRICCAVGAVIGALGIIAAVVLVVMRIFDPGMQMGWPSLMSVMLICSGLILAFLGIIGEYVGRLLMTANNAPQYILKTTETSAEARNACLKGRNDDPAQVDDPWRHGRVRRADEAFEGTPLLHHRLRWIRR